MGLYIITYDLRKPERDYTTLYETIKEIGNWQHPLESVWFVYTPFLDANGIYQRLRPVIDNNDYILINKVDPLDKQGWMVRTFWDWYNNIANRN